MDITKYLTKKDIELSNDDINIEKLEKDLRKGYVLSSEVESARKEALKENTEKYAELESKYNNLEKTYNDLQEKNVEISKSNGGLKLQVEMMSQGFGKDQFEEVSKLRNTLYAEEQDDSKAIGLIKEKFGATYFPKTQTQEVPTETNFKTEEKPTHEIKITRHTGIKDIMQK